MKGLIEAAIDFAKAGCFIFPAKFAAKQKRSHTSAEKSNGNPWGYTRDPDEIHQYWKRWPRAAIGLPTGVVNGLFVVDVDTLVGHDHDGRESLIKLEIKYGSLPRTRMAESPTGSRHYYYKQPLGVRIPCNASKLGPGIDVRGDGGFVMAPPSDRPKRGRYAWINHVDIAAAPKWLSDLVVLRPRALQTIALDPEIKALMLQDGGKGVSMHADDVAKLREPDDVWSKVAAALTVIPADLNYSDWFRIGCAVYAGLGESGFALWDDWSATAPHKYPREGCDAKWRECAKVHSIRVETLFWMADQCEGGDWRDLYARLRQRVAVSC
jgi:hypothetical protein